VTMIGTREDSGHRITLAVPKAVGDVRTGLGSARSHTDRSTGIMGPEGRR
jgi:hypothetical protein